MVGKVAITGTAGVSPAFVECQIDRLSDSTLSELGLEAGETPAVPVIATFPTCENC